MSDLLPGSSRVIMSSASVPDQLARISKELKCLRDARQRARNGLRHPWLRAMEAQVAEVIRHHPGGGEAALRTYVSRQLQSRQVSTRTASQEEFQRQVDEEVALTMRRPAEAWQRNPLRSCHRESVARAETFLAEASVVAWIDHVNEQRGCAPTGNMVFAMLARMGVRAGKDSARRQWLLRFRRRWRLRHGRLKKQPPVTLDYVRLACRVFYQWIEFAEARVPPNRRLVFVNFDESSVPFAFPGMRGYIAPRSGTEPASLGSRTERLASNSNRGSYTFLGFISDCPEIQRRLPRILIGKHTRLSKRLMRGAPNQMVDGMEVWARESSWVTQSLMFDILRRLFASWMDIQHEIYPIVILDCAPQHISTEIVNFAHGLGMDLVFIPGRLTFLLQPLDVLVFQLLKRDLRETWMQERSRHEAGHVDVSCHLRVVAECTKRVLSSGSWQGAFDMTGITSGRRRLHSTLRRLFECDMEDISSDAPSVDQLRFISSPQQPLPHDALINRAPVASGHGVDGGVHGGNARRVPRGRRLNGWTPRDRAHPSAAMP